MIKSVNVSSDAHFSNNEDNSSNVSASESCPFVPEGIKELEVTINVLTLVIALVGNSLLIAAFVRMKEPVMLLIANMAASDILSGIFLFPRLLAFEIIGSRFWQQIHGLGGIIFCKMSAFMSDISLAVSSFSLAIIAVERFLAVVLPLKTRKITAKTRRCLVASTWIASIAIHSPYLYSFDLEEEHDNMMCTHSNIPPDTLRRYIFFLFLTVALIPLAVVSILYPIIVTKLRTDKMSAHRSAKWGRRSRKRNMKLLKLAMATVLAIFICWIPYTVISFLNLFVPERVPQCSHIFNVVEYASRVLLNVYCAVNPVLCFLFLRNFRGHLIQMCKLKRRGTFEIDRNKISRRSGTSTGDTSFGIELLHAKLSSSNHSTSE